MKRMKKILYTMPLIVGITLTINIPAFAGTWQQNMSGWWYQNDNGSYPVANWEKIDNNWYYFNTDGYMVTGWVQTAGKWYYCNQNGSMATNCWIDGKYYVGSDGAMYVNAITPDGFKVDNTGSKVIKNSSTDVSSQSYDYSSYIGKYSVDLSEEYGGAPAGTFYITIKIADISQNKIYGTVKEVYGEGNFEADFSNGVEINDKGIFSVQGILIEGEGSGTWKRFYQISSKSGKPVIYLLDNKTKEQMECCNKITP